MNVKTSTFPRSNVLVLGSNSVYSLLPSTLITQADALLERHRLEEAVDLADAQLKRLQSRVSVSPEEVSSPFSAHDACSTLVVHLLLFIFIVLGR